MSHPKLEAVVARVRNSLEPAVERLSSYLRIPAISCDPERSGDVRALADKIAADLTALGLDKSRVLDVTVPGGTAHPIVAAEWMKAGPGKPTVLVYGHFDLQPVKGEAWDTPPHEPTRKGDRLYARGAADDMGGWVSHLVVLEAWLKEAGELPCNVKLILEGEEEIGSPNLERFMDAYPEVFTSDVMILTDCENPSTEIPGLTVSLRGLLEVEIIVETAESDVHSGLWGNVAPDAAMCLVKLLSRLVDEDGRFSIAPVEVPKAWVEASHDVPYHDDVIRKGARLKPTTKPLPNRGLSPATWIWRQPAVTILSTTLPTPDREKNALRKRASATISIRVAPGQTHELLLAALDRTLTENTPGGVTVQIEQKPGGAQSWLYEPKGPAFEAADRAYEKAWGRPLLRIGVGGSIPFVALFGRRFGDLPLILNGVMDPETTAHGPNESMHLGVFQKTMLANAHLLDELAALPSLKS